MPTNQTRRQLLDRVKASNFPGSILDVFKAADQGVDLVAEYEQQQMQEQQMQVANTPQEQQVGLREQHAMGNTDASMAFPNVQPNQSFNTVGMKAPINIEKINDQGHLVESYKNVPPGIQDLPTGPYKGTIIESPAGYQTGGPKRVTKSLDRMMDTAKNFSGNKKITKKKKEISDNIGFDEQRNIFYNKEIQRSYEQQRGRFNPGFIHDPKHYKKWKKEQEEKDVRSVQTGGYKEEFPGLLPEVEVSALTDESYNKLSEPQKQIYNTFVTPQGIAQTVDLGDDRSMHYKSALQMTEDLGVRNISNKPSFVFNKLFNRKKENKDFTAHVNPILKNVTIPAHSVYRDRLTFGNDIIKKLQDNEGYWAQSMTKQERADQIRRFQDAQTNASRKKYFENLIAEYAHIPEFWRKETFINKPKSFANDIMRFIEGKETDHARYHDKDHYEYMTHNAPDSFEEQLKNKYEMKEQGGVRRYQYGGGQGLGLDLGLEFGSRGKVYASPTYRMGNLDAGGIIGATGKGDNSHTFAGGNFNLRFGNNNRNLRDYDTRFMGSLQGELGKGWTSHNYDNNSNPNARIMDPGGWNNEPVEEPVTQPSNSNNFKMPNLDASARLNLGFGRPGAPGCFGGFCYSAPIPSWNVSAFGEYGTKQSLRPELNVGIGGRYGALTGEYNYNVNTKKPGFKVGLNFPLFNQR